MPDVALLLGPIAFQDFEVPSGINFGGRHRLALHRLPGGSRVVHAMGRDDAEISFSGIFTGSDATLRARGLDELRVAGIVLPLTWDVFFYSVLLSEFRADYRNGSWIPYRIVCTVLQDEASELIQSVVSLASAVLTDIGTAAGYAADAGVDLSAVNAQLAAPGATVRGTAAYTAARSSLIDARSSIVSSTDQADWTLRGMDPAGAASAQAGVAGLLAATDATGRLSGLTSAGAYVRRAEVNLANAST
jgi:hypothetical protein